MNTKYIKYRFTGMLLSIMIILSLIANFSFAQDTGNYIVATQQSQSIYEPGSNIQIDCNIEYSGDLTAIGLLVNLPEEWTFDSSDGVDLPYYVKEIDGGLEIYWTTVPDSPIDFNYILNVPQDEIDEAKISSIVKYRFADGQEEEKFLEPLIIGPEISAMQSIDDDSYIPSAELQINAEIEYDGSLNALGLVIDLPEGWSFISTGGEDKPYNEKILENGVEIFWTTMPDSPVEFNYTLQAPDDATNDVIISAQAKYRRTYTEQALNFNNLTLTSGQGIVVEHDAGTYSPGSNITINNKITYTSNITAVGFVANIPEGWTFVSGDDEFDDPKVVDNKLEYYWVEIPDSPVEFTYTLYVPENEEGDKEIVSKAIYRVADGPEKDMNASPDPLMLSYVAPDEVIITASASEGGIISPCGEVRVLKGTSQTFTRTAYEGYKFDQWIVDGEPDLDAPYNEYRFDDVKINHTIRAEFKIIEYTVTSSVKGAGGTISPEGINSVDYGKDITLTANPLTGYVVDKWYVDEVEKQSGGETFILEDVKDNYEVSVSFSQIMHTITASATTGGNIDPQGEVPVYHNADQDFYIWPDDDYFIAYAIIDGAKVTITENTYTFENITADHSIKISFAEKPPVYEVTAKVEGGGNITPEGISKVIEGNPITFTIEPNENYVVKELLVDSVEQSLDLIINDQFTIESVLKDTSVKVIFIRQFKILASAQDGGSIDPTGESLINKGSDITYTIELEDGYILDEVLVDEKPVTLTEGKYTF